ncbi:uncharacterized protein LOC112044988 [Bicyclus anynana]|uniref:Uncharacterized protein LOC112044988 n=1 Tax=Bicyclus anynana TaxID=110368 RepID=A0A6J1MML0_BICAN|nr:uncharacterized protein LOC112044988 [Bicyclus anynana]
MFKLVVLFSVLALAAAKPGWVAPALTYSAVPVSSVSQYSSGVYHGAVIPSVYSGYSPVVPGYVPTVSALAQAPNSPAVVLDAYNGVPLDTPEVVAARAAHYQAKALAGVGVHTIAKRSVVTPVSPVVSPYTSVVSAVGSPYTSVVSPVAPVSPYYRSVVSPVTYSTPYVSAYNVPGYAYSAVVPKALSVHPW